MDGSPEVVVIAGPNGAGKSTCATTLVPEGAVFLNADEIARDLPGYPSRSADFQAGRRLLARMDGLEERRADFALETTLANRSFGPRLSRLRAEGYRVRVYVPFGREWFPYFMRRLGERPANVGFVIRGILRER